jgi:uncharacterized protein involved in exopolysaccharide biosynthesis
MSEKNDELDLQKLFFDFVLLIINNLKLILTLFILGALLGLGYGIISKKSYESRMLISSSILTLSYTEEILNNLNLIAIQNNTKLIAEKLQISETTAESIKKLSVENAFDEKGELLKESEKTFLRITVTTRSPEIFPEVQKGVIHYIEDNDYVRVRTEQKKQYFKQLIARVNNEISDLEGLKERMLKGNFFESPKGNIMFDPTVINSKIIELTKEKINDENALILADNVQVIEGFTAFSQPLWPRKSISIIIGSILGLLIAAIVIAVNAVLRKVHQIKAAQNRLAE